MFKVLDELESQMFRRALLLFKGLPGNDHDRAAFFLGFGEILKIYYAELEKLSGD